MSEKFDTQGYRDELAESLKVKRSLGEEGRDLAKDQLEMEKETVNYKRADIQHQEDNLAKKVEKADILEKALWRAEITPDPEIISAETAISKLKAEGYTTEDYYTKDLLTKVNWQEPLKSSYEVVSFSVADLFGDKNNHTFGDIKAKAVELGLGLIPQALAPSIRLNYPKAGDWTRMALKESIRDRGGLLRVFLCSGDGLESWLNNDFGRDVTEWNHDSRFFFVRE